jgi:hypothetical protein
MLIDFCFIYNLGIHQGVDGCESPLAQLKYYSDLLYSKRHSPRKSATLMLRAARKALKYETSRIEFTKVDNVYVRYWIFRRQGLDYEYTYERCIS